MSFYIFISSIGIWLRFQHFSHSQPQSQHFLFCFFWFIISSVSFYPNHEFYIYFSSCLALNMFSFAFLSLSLAYLSKFHFNHIHPTFSWLDSMQIKMNIAICMHGRPLPCTELINYSSRTNADRFPLPFTATLLSSVWNQRCDFYVLFIFGSSPSQTFGCVCVSIGASIFTKLTTKDRKLPALHVSQVSECVGSLQHIP